MTRLFCARQYDVPQWIELGMTQLLYSPLKELTAEDCALLGLPAMLLIFKTKEKLDVHRRACAVFCPAVVHDENCYFHGKCEKAWGQVWWGECDRPGVARTLLLSRRPMKTIVDGLDNIHGDMDMGYGCKQLTVSGL